jgi:hypothetical protein
MFRYDPCNRKGGSVPILVGLPGGMDVLEVHPQHHFADRHQLRQHGLNLLGFLRRITALELGTVAFPGLGHRMKGAHILLALVCQRRQDGVWPPMMSPRL